MISFKAFGFVTAVGGFLAGVGAEGGLRSSDVEIGSVTTECNPELIAKAMKDYKTLAAFKENFKEAFYFNKYNKKTSLLGKGGQGSVHLYELKNENCDFKVAVKHVKISPYETEEEADKRMREIETHQKINHPNVVGLYHTISTEESLDGTPSAEKQKSMYIFMEPAAGQNLYERIETIGMMTEEDVRSHARQLINGIAGIHAEGVVHRDLKLENVVGDFESKSPTLKILDFGYSKETCDSEQKHTMCGTPVYVAPEVLRETLLGKDLQTAPDVWAFGIILYELTTGRVPFASRNRLRLYQMIESAPVEVPTFVEDALKNLIERCLEKDPSERISVEEIKGHPFLEPNQSDGVSPLRNDQEDENTVTNENAVTIMANIDQGEKKLKGEYLNYEHGKGYKVLLELFEDGETTGIGKANKRFDRLKALPDWHSGGNAPRKGDDGKWRTEFYVPDLPVQ